MKIWLLAAVLGCAVNAAADEATERRLRMLEEQLRRAQKEIQDLRGQVEQQKAIDQATQKQVQTVEETAKTAAKGVELPEWLKRTTLFGDTRVRYEGFFHQPAKEGTKVTARNRERLRFRLGVKVAFSDEVSTTARFASGNIDDPISTNEDLSHTFDRKNFNLDWAFITFTPGNTFNIRPGLVALQGGKFPNPMFRVNEMVFDDDLSPEGFSETFSVLKDPIGPLDQLKIYFQQWTFGEVSNSTDGWMIGGQINPSMHFGNTRLDFGIGQYSWRNPDLIAQDLNTNSALKNTNLIITDSSGAVTAYESGFFQTNPNLQVTFPNLLGTQPLVLYADYVHNWWAETDDDSGYMVGWRLGQTKVRGDWSLYAFWERLEQEAALSVFTASDFGPGATNQEGGQVGIDYQLLNPLTISTRSWFTNYITPPADTNNPTLFRVQVDALVKF